MKKNRDEIEKDIIAASKKLFIEKGYKSTTMRDIATEANVNLAMMNYYFQSKDKLFDIIFEEAFLIMSTNIIKVLSSEKSVLDKLSEFAAVYMDGLIQNPMIPGFIMHEIYADPYRLINKMLEKKEISNYLNSFYMQVSKEIDEGKIKPFHPLDIFINTIALCIFPFIAKPIIEKLPIQGQTNLYNQLLELRKETVGQFLINALEIKKK